MCIYNYCINYKVCIDTRTLAPKGLKRMYMYTCMYIHTIQHYTRVYTVHTVCRDQQTLYYKVYIIIIYYIYIFVSWLKGGSKRNLCIISHVAQVSDTPQVTRQVSLLELIA